MQQITINKASLKGGMGLKVSYTQKERDGSYSDITRDGSSPVHEDLLSAFKDLDVHLALISEIIPENEIDNVEDPVHELLDSFSVNGIDIKEKDSGVSLQGKRRLSTGKSLSLSTPAVKWSAKKKYTYSGELAEITERLKHEVEAYLFEGKHAPDAQTSLEFDEDGPDDEGISEVPYEDDGNDFIDQIGDDE